MIDREKVAVMTQEAIQEKRNRRKVFPAANFYMYDYVSFQVIKGLIGATFLFLIMAAGWLVYTMDEWISSYSIVQLIHMLTRIGVIYAAVMVVLAVILILIYSLNYVQSKHLLKAQQHNLKRLDRYYEMEDRKEGEA